MWQSNNLDVMTSLRFGFASIAPDFVQPSRIRDVINDVTTYTYPHNLTHGMAVVDVDQALNDLSEMVDRVQDGERITITSRSCNAVLMSEEDYNSLVETIHLLSDPDMAADLDRTRGTPLSEMEVWTQ